ncbi:hypothetical protein L7F22_000594 [Adiantum nelumboides]|nr:hypothetical protein [Adiantum nelumboides]
MRPSLRRRATTRVLIALWRVSKQPDASFNEIIKVNKELSRLEELIYCISRLREKQKEMENLRELIRESANEADICKMANEELDLAAEQEKFLQQELLFKMLPRDEADSRSCILEVRAGTGGEEASLFAMDLFKMYEGFAQKSCWKFEVIDVTETSLRGYKEASASITGSGAYGKLKFESGVHRVQRVPITEKSGRVHTSAASVVILPQADEVVSSGAHHQKGEKQTSQPLQDTGQQRGSAAEVRMT